MKETDSFATISDYAFFWVRCGVLVPKHIYPRMLIFHSLIVLIIAFVGQLIVSDKSVTEPL